MIVCGDLNVAHGPLDLARPEANHHNAGYTDEERAKLDELLTAGFTDTFRQLHPAEKKYSWWSYMGNARAKDVGWRIDYFLVSSWAADLVTGAAIHTEVMGSDHAPIELNINL